MIDPQLHKRFVSAYTDAAIGYSSAFVEAWSQLASQSIDQSAAFMTALSDMSKPGGAAKVTSRPFSFTAQPAHPSYPAAFRTWPELFATQFVPTPERAVDMAQAWASLWMKPVALAGWRSPMALWPSIALMMSYGMPGKIATPVAEANAAALEAAEAAKEAVSTVFSSYHSESGHASSQLMAPMVAMMTAMTIPGANAMLCQPSKSSRRRPVH